MGTEPGKSGDGNPGTEPGKSGAGNPGTEPLFEGDDLV